MHYNFSIWSKTKRGLSACIFFSTFSGPNTPRVEEPTGKTHVEQNREATGKPGSHEELRRVLVPLAPCHKAPRVFEHFCFWARWICELFSKPLKRVNQRRGEARQAPSGMLWGAVLLRWSEKQDSGLGESLRWLRRAAPGLSSETRGGTQPRTQTLPDSPLFSLFKLFNELSA